MRRWKCPLCDLGRLAPEKLNREDSRGYCFGCSEKTGHLVRLIVPTIVQEKAMAKAQRCAAATRRREREKEREWTRQHTWPGVRELRWAHWAVKGTRTKGELPKYKNVASIPEAYAQTFRLGMPNVDKDSTNDKVTARGSYLQRIGVDEATIARLQYGHDRDAFAVVYRHCLDHAIDWLIEDLLADGGGTFDETAKTAIRGVAERTNLQDDNDIKTLNTVILNAFALGAKLGA